MCANRNGYPRGSSPRNDGSCGSSDYPEEEMAMNARVGFILRKIQMENYNVSSIE
jgi:hypothetical protein